MEAAGWKTGQTDRQRNGQDRERVYFMIDVLSRITSHTAKVTPTELRGGCRCEPGCADVDASAADGDGNAAGNDVATTTDEERTDFLPG